MGFVKDTFNSITGKDAADASKKGAAMSAQGQREALNYLKEKERIPSQFREGALGQLGGLYGLEGGDPNAMSQIQQNPIYQATMGQLPQQEEAILRNQSATGALRSGGTEMMLANNKRQNKLSALQNTMGGLQNMAGLQSYAPQIAQGVAGVGQTLGQGQIASANARQQGIGNTIGLGMNALSLAGFSDIRLKDNIKPAGERYGHDWYTWEWNDEAKELGLSGEAEGVLAQDIAVTHPEAVGLSQGYLTVNYGSLGLA